MGKIQDSLNFYQVKVFLYKYTPEFRIETNTESATKKRISGEGVDDSDSVPSVEFDSVQGKAQKVDTKTPQDGPYDKPVRLNKIDRYTIELNEDKFFRKFDISEYVSSYTFSQSLDDNTFNWNLTLYNTLIPKSKLDSQDFKIEGSALDDNALKLLAEYEDQSKALVAKSFIKEAKKQRGTEVDQFQVKDIPKLLKTSGLRLEDLIQPFDIISVFLYKNNVPLTELRGTKEEVFPITKNGKKIKREKFIVTNNKAKQPSITDAFKGKKLTKFDLTQESILLSPDNSDSSGDTTLFSNEFNGFVVTKSTNESVGSVNTIVLSGAGITRLFGATRRVLKSSIMQKSLYSVGETATPEAYTPYQNRYVGKRIQDIFLDLFDSIYRIKQKFTKEVVIENVIVDGRPRFVNTSATNNDGTLQTYSKVDVPDSSFYDISALEVGNNFQTNLFSIPPFLLSLVMKRMGYNYRQPINEVIKKSLISQVSTATGNPKKVDSVVSYASTGDEVTAETTTVEVDKNKVVDQKLVDSLLDSKPELQTKGTSLGRKPPLRFSIELNQLRAYFKFFENVLKDFAPEMKTPFEIIDEIQAKTFLEFFERPDGQIFVRPPEYNDTTKVIFSSTLKVINSTYSSSTANLLSRQNVGWAQDIVNQIYPLHHFAFVDGKLLIQYGLLETSADPNPNAFYKKAEDEEINKKRQLGLFQYAEYLLRLHNASLHTSIISCDYDKRIIVGRTYFDEKNKKFGYINHVSKNVNIGNNVTLTFSLTYVRDAFLGSTKRTEAQIVLIENEETGEQEEITAEVGQEFDGQISSTQIFLTEDRNEKLDGSFLQFEPLERLVDLAQGFSLTSLDKTISDPEPTTDFTEE